MNRRRYGRLLHALRFLGDEEAIREFEVAFLRWTPGCGVVATSSGIQALSSLIRQLGIAPGEAMIVPAYSDESVLLVLAEHEIRPVFVDIDPRTHTIDPRACEAIPADGASALMVTHLFGNPADMVRLRALADERGWRLIEDCAHAIGAQAAGVPVGTWGDGALFSFSSTKPFATFGGGVAVSRHGSVIEGIREELRRLPRPSPRRLWGEILHTVALDVVSHTVWSSAWGPTGGCGPLGGEGRSGAISTYKSIGGGGSAALGHPGGPDSRHATAGTRSTSTKTMLPPVASREDGGP